MLHYEEERLELKPPCFRLAQHYRPGLGTRVSHCHGNHLQVPLSPPSRCPCPKHPGAHTLARRRGQSHQAEVSDPLAGRERRAASPHSRGAVSSPRALEDLAPHQGWCSGLFAAPSRPEHLSPRERKLHSCQQHPPSRCRQRDTSGTALGREGTACPAASSTHHLDDRHRPDAVHVDVHIDERGLDWEDMKKAPSAGPGALAEG